MFLDKEVWVGICGANYKYWISKGYGDKIPMVKEGWHKNKYVVRRGTKILVKIEDLPPNSMVKVRCKCENPDCGKERLLIYSKCGKYCKSCAPKTKEFKEKISKSRIGKHLSQETKRKIGEAHRGEKCNWWKGGKPHCKSCNKELSHYETKFCQDCIGKEISGDKSSNWKGGNPSCIDCGKKLAHRESVRCNSCAGKQKRGIKHYKWNPNKSELHKYWVEVRRETRKHKKELYENWDGTDYYTKEDISNLSDFYITVDHKNSVVWGFENNIDPKELGRFENLCICSRNTNSSKNYLTEDEFKNKLSGAING